MNTEDNDDTAAQENRWKKWAKYAGVVVSQTAVVVATAAVMHALDKSKAQSENEIALLRGQLVGLREARSEWW